MPTRWDPHERPAPLVDCLLHEAVLVQAWKKAHGYIRSRNWYADVLELDLSAINLKETIASWRSQYAKDGMQALRPRRMRIVPAPKSSQWGFERLRSSKPTVQWRPRPEERGMMRPLGHLGIRDQTVATAAMICLSDAVESAQGDCSVGTDEAISNRVCNYGNRLYCEWNKGKNGPTASFGWGNATSYRKYFQDYQAFLTRPHDVCASAKSKLDADEQLGVVSLDLTGFYDRISVPRLVELLREVCRRRGSPDEDTFWSCLVEVFKWKWADDPLIPTRDILRGGRLPAGLPQGLVASGFFSNAYMLDFDAAMCRASKSPHSAHPFVLMDYCRYVDDLRLTVRWKQRDDFGFDELMTACRNYVDGVLRKHALGQECNAGKTGYTSYESLQAKEGTAATMTLVQHRLSGPMDMEAMEETSLALERLLATVDNRAEERFATEGATERPALAAILVHSAEVRDDTVKRFGAYRHMKVLREMRGQIADDPGSDPLEIEKIDADIHISARRMIRLWMADPSLTLVLRCGLGLMPCEKLLDPVLVELQRWIGSSSAESQDVVARWTCLYIAADLLRAGVTETGVGVPVSALPEEADLEAYRDRLRTFAGWLLSPGQECRIPWYVKQQALFFIASMKVPLEDYSFATREKCLRDYASLARIMSADVEPLIDTPLRLVPLLMVARQLGQSTRWIVGQLTKILRRVDADEGHRIAETVLLSDTDLFKRLWRTTARPGSHADWRSSIATIYALPTSGKGKMTDTGSVALLNVARAQNNPFTQENAALQLMLAMLNAVATNKSPLGRGIAPQAIDVSCTAWSQLKDPGTHASLEVHWSDISATDPRYQLPSWCKGHRRWQLALGRILRCAITGSDDYTTAGFYRGIERSGYRGIRTSWYKRQHGLFQRPDTLGGPHSSCSPWIAELLAKLLAWPGCREIDRLISDWHEIQTPRDLRKLILRRLNEQAKLYGRASDLPVYVFPVAFDVKSPPYLTVVLIQTARPKEQDFKTFGMTLGDPAFRPIRRGHLASLLRIAEKQLDLRKTYDASTEADLVLLPEVAVHESDLDLVERFIDKRKAMVFCGLVFRNMPGVGMINTARWIIPDRRPQGRSFFYIDQGKRHLTDDEINAQVVPWRPHQVVVELQLSHSGKYRMSGSICYDATDLKLASDLRDITDMFIVPAHNKDVGTYDLLLGALCYHMFQHVLVVNSGEYGGTAAMAPYHKDYERVLSHHHGGGHASVAIIEVDLSHYQKPPADGQRQLKTPPAGWARHKRVSLSPP